MVEGGLKNITWQVLNARFQGSIIPYNKLLETRSCKLAFSLFFVNTTHNFSTQLIKWSLRTRIFLFTGKQRTLGEKTGNFRFGGVATFFSEREREREKESKRRLVSKNNF